MALLDHFSHDHPLMLISELPSEDGTGDREVLCDGCQRAISGSSYSCVECKYFLHEKCANLRRYINHPKHLEHHLKLFPKSPYSLGGCICNVCRIEDWKWFTYHCSICEFDVHVECALDEGVVKHESHPHQLTVVPKKASFYCDACGTKEEDNSLFCNTCGFWIHKSCATSPTTFEHSGHDHPLLLNYFLPYENRTFEYECDICRDKVHPTKWVYNCYRCRYFAHPSYSRDLYVESYPLYRSTGDIIVDNPTIIRFPLTTEQLIELLNKLLNEASLNGTDESPPEIDHFSHDHSLVLFGGQSASTTNEEELVLCDCCIRPITSAVPYYGCSQCNYFLHRSCTNLPSKLQHPCHPDHLLDIYAPKYFAQNIWCHSCRIFTNGLNYGCNTCNYYLDISCAFFPKIIKHEGHKHPLKMKEDETDHVCCACGVDRCGRMKFSCDACDFHMETSCAELPTTFKHDWDDDPLILSYPPYSDHPDPFFCEICEEEMHPKRWAYRSRSRPHFYHTICVIPYDEYSKKKFGQTLEFKDHPHPLTYVRNSKNKSPSLCDQCGQDLKGKPVFECALCNVLICTRCVRAS